MELDNRFASWLSWRPYRSLSIAVDVIDGNILHFAMILMRHDASATKYLSL